MDKKHNAPPAPGRATAHGRAPAALDPTHDIDAKATVLAVLVGAALVFLGLYLLLVIFDRVVFQEHERKSEHLPNAELETNLKRESAFLQGHLDDGVKGKDIEQAIQEQLKK